MAAQTTGAATASRKRRRPVSPRDVAYCVLGALVALGGHRLDLQPIIAGRVALADPPITSAASSGGSPVEEAAAIAVAQCSAQLKRCRETKVVENRAHTKRRLQLVTLGLPKGMKLVRPAQQQSPNKNIYVEPNCAFRGPYQSMVPCYTTEALRREIERHDRFIVDSLAYMNAFDGNAIPAYFSSISGEVAAKPKRVTIIILTINRYVPYLAAVLTSLLRGHRPEFFRDTVDLHVINIERRDCKCRYHLFSEYQSRIPFASFHGWTAAYPEHDTIADETKLYIANQRRDYVRALNLCKEIGLDWCMILEDDVIATANFIPKFLNLVSKEDAVKMRLGGVISMYYPLNDIYNFNEKELWRASYAESDAYQLDVNATRYSRADTSGERSIEYQIESNDRTYGMAANAYPSDVLDELIAFLEVEPSNSTTVNTDVAIMSAFIRKTGKKRLKISPSLVSHIGAYSEHRAHVKDLFVGNRKESKKGSGVFFMLSSDVRFQLEAGWDEFDGILEEHESTKGHMFK